MRGEDPKERVTADGVTVKVGDIVWRDHCGVRSKRLSRWDIGWGWPGSHWFATERACIEAAIVEREKLVAKARRDIRSAQAYAAKLTERLAGLR